MQQCFCRAEERRTGPGCESLKAARTEKGLQEAVQQRGRMPGAGTAAAGMAEHVLLCEMPELHGKVIYIIEKSAYNRSNRPGWIVSGRIIIRKRI